MEKVRRKKMQVRKKVGKSPFTVVAPEGWKVGSLKRRVRSQLARWEMKNCTPLWREARFQVKMYETHQVRSIFGSCDVEKAHAVVARSTFPSQNVQSSAGSDHFWAFRSRFVWQAQGIGHLVKSQQKREGFCSRVNYNPTLYYTTLHSTTVRPTTLHYTKFHYATAAATTTLHYTLHYSPLHYTQLHHTTLHYTTLRYTTLH